MVTESLVDAVAKFISCGDGDLAGAAAGLQPHLKPEQRADFVLPLLLWSRQVNQRNVERNARLKELEARIERLESNPPGCKWMGTYKAGTTYEPGAFVQRSGLWLCLNTTTTAPGSDPTLWRLVVKQGRALDAR